MRAILIVGLCIGAVQAVPAQTRPQDELYRGPIYGWRPVDYVAPPSGAPLKFGTGRLNLNYYFSPRVGSYSLNVPVQSNSIRSIRGEAITLRLAFGPTQHGMVTFRMRSTGPDLGPPFNISPNSAPRMLPFEVAPEDQIPGPLALKPHMKVAYTVERIDDDNGIAMFENPDATELLWEALGRPALSSQ